MYRQIVEISNFIDKIELSKHRRARYYKRGDKIPKKYQEDNYTFNKNGILIHTDSGERIIKNSRTVGKPNIKVITGQYYWQGANPHIRRKMKREMSKFFCNYLNNFKVVKEEDYPIGIRIDLYDSISDGTQQDIDNFMFLYRKVIHDVLVDKDKSCKKIIKDDSKEYVQEINSTFFPIKNRDDRKLVIEIYSLNK